MLICTRPFDTVKVRLQTQPTVNPVYSGVMDCVSKTAKWEGLRGMSDRARYCTMITLTPGFYKGVSSPLAGQVCDC